jgi:tRNA (guanine-N(7)-)-methyltransferase
MTINFNRSFSRRVGKTLSTLQKNALEELLPKILFVPEKLPKSLFIAEIGIGMGEHFINIAKNTPDTIHIGFEPYLNGIANALLLAKKDNISNIRLWPDDVDLVLQQLPDASIEKLYILFPDPWPKTKQKKRRILCEDRLKIFEQKLVNNGILYFASDIEDYVINVQKIFKSFPNFKAISNENNTPHEGYIQTKYNKKAEEEGRIVKFLQWVKIV